MTTYIGPCEKKTREHVDTKYMTRGHATKKKELTQTCMAEFLRTLKQTNHTVIDLDETFSKSEIKQI